MKTKILTRKIVIGLLMGLVLALGVPGVVDAVTITVDGSKPPSNVIDDDAHMVDGPVSLTITATDEDTANPTASISISASNIQFTSPTFTTSLTYSEATTTDTQTTTKRPFATNISVSGYFTRVGVASITVTYTDIDGDGTGSDTALGRQTHKFTYYVTRSNSAIPKGTILQLYKDGSRINSEGYITGLNGRRDFYIQSGSSDYPVTYSVTPSAARGLFTGATFADRATPTNTTSIASRVRVWLSMNSATLTDDFGRGGTTVVRVQIGHGTDSGTAPTGEALRSDYNVAYIIGTPELDINLTPGEATSAVTGQPGSLTASNGGITVNANDTTKQYKFIGGIAGADAGTITATVTDGAGQAVPAGVLVKFDVVDKSVRGGFLSVDTTSFTVVNNRNAIPETALDLGRTLYVRTDTNGIATVTYELGTSSGEQEIRVTSVGKSQSVTAALAASTRPQRLFIESNQRQGNTKKYDLVAELKDGDIPAGNEVVTFTTNQGTLTRVSSAPSTGAINQDRLVNVETDALGLARVIYDIGENTGRQEIHASIENETVTFVVNGPASTTGTNTGTNTGTGTTTQTPALTISTSGTGATRSVTVTATNAQGAEVTGLAVDLSGTALAASRTVVSGTPVTITLPTDPGTYTLQAIAAGYTVARITLTVDAPPQPGTLSIERVGDRIGGQQAIRVTVRTAEGGTPSSAVLVTLTGATTPPSFTIPAGDGSRSLTVTLPSTTAAHVLTVNATGYDDDSVIVPAAGTGQQTGTPDTTRTVAGEADSIEIDGQRQRSGTVNQNIPLRVQVTDANGNGVRNVRVTFRILAPGQGRLSQRGNGRAIQDTTDARGYASATLTPLGEGDLIVRVNAGEISPVTFIIAVGEASEAETDTGTDTGTRDVDVTPSREISPVVQVNASQRPPMLWVDGGKIYALVGASVQEFASGVDNALNIAVGGGKVYWTEKTGDSAGTINSANFNGSNVQELASILAVPMGIAVDATNSKLYWTNSRGRIQSANLDGSDITTVLPNLPGPMDIAVARGNLYWTQYDATAGAGNVGILNPTGQQKIARYISTGSDMPGSLVINGGKVYWTEMTGTSSGTINSANLSGTNVMQLASISAVPSGIAVETARSKLYWTNSRGRIQRANLNGSGIGNVVTGLGSPGDMVSSNSIAAPVAGGTPSGSGTTASNKYDVNGDGSVDGKDVDALIVAVAAGVTDAKYDVNGDGKVDIFDVSAVSTNRDDGAASAPALVGNLNLSTVQIDRLQEQIDLLIASNDRSPDTMRILIYLQQLIVMARPEKTQLLANYPNPFNPETWIPYELATDTNVKITIYNTQGVVIRTLELGHQAAGYYTGRDRAAYWDGRNAFGEQVASGIYFYQLETDEISSMRKMVILK